MPSNDGQTIFRYWTGTPAPAFATIIAAAIDGYSPGARHDLTEWDVEDTLAEGLAQAVTAVAADPQQQRTHRANLLRWWLLYHHGGVWLDHDVVPLCDLTRLPRPWCAGLGLEFVSCAIGMDRGDPLAHAMLRVGLSAETSDRPAAEVSGDAILNGWVRPNRPGERPIHELAAGRLYPVPLPFDALGRPVTPVGVVPVGGRTPYQLVHLWNHRDKKE